MTTAFVKFSKGTTTRAAISIARPAIPPVCEALNHGTSWTPSKTGRIIFDTVPLSSDYLNGEFPYHLMDVPFLDLTALSAK
jgi:hypothetical protein